MDWEVQNFNFVLPLRTSLYLGQPEWPFCFHLFNDERAWGQPLSEASLCTSLVPFPSLPLLLTTRCYDAQWWSLWLIHLGLQYPRQGLQFNSVPYNNVSWRLFMDQTPWWAWWKHNRTHTPCSSGDQRGFMKEMPEGMSESYAQDNVENSRDTCAVVWVKKWIRWMKGQRIMNIKVLWTKMSRLSSHSICHI